MCQAWDDALFYEKASASDHNRDRDRLGRQLRRPHSWRPPHHNDDVGPESNEVGGEIREPI